MGSHNVNTCQYVFGWVIVNVDVKKNPGGGGGEIFGANVQTGPGAHPASCTKVPGLSRGGKTAWVVVRTTHPFLAPRSRKNKAIPLPTL
jgi:hypothetical protein